MPNPLMNFSFSISWRIVFIPVRPGRDFIQSNRLFSVSEDFRHSSIIRRIPGSILSDTILYNELRNCLRAEFTRRRNSSTTGNSILSSRNLLIAASRHVFRVENLLPCWVSHSITVEWSSCSPGRNPVMLANYRQVMFESLALPLIPSEKCRIKLKLIGNPVHYIVLRHRLFCMADNQGTGKISGVP